MVDSSLSSRGWAEFFALITSILLILNCLCLTAIIKDLTKPIFFSVLILYSLIGIVPMAIESYFTLIPLIIASLIIIMVSAKLVIDATAKQSVVINGIVLTLNCIWGFLMIGI